MDKAGRVQIPRELLSALRLEGNKVKVELQGSQIVISRPEGEKANEGQETLS